MEFKGIHSEEMTFELERAARAYWEGEPTEPYPAQSRFETLFIGTLKIVQRVD